MCCELFTHSPYTPPAVLSGSCVSPRVCCVCREALTASCPPCVPIAVSGKFVPPAHALRGVLGRVDLCCGAATTLIHTHLTDPSVQGSCTSWSPVCPSPCVCEAVLAGAIPVSSQLGVSWGPSPLRITPTCPSLRLGSEPGEGAPWGPGAPCTSRLTRSSLVSRRPQGAPWPAHARRAAPRSP